MRNRLIFLIILPYFGFTQSIYFPPTTDNTWDTLSLANLGWCGDSVQALYDFLEQEQSKSFLLLKDGKIVCEKYFGTYTQDSTHRWYSAGKSFRAMQIGIAQQEGLLSINDKTSDHLGVGWSGLSQAQEDSITIWHQLTMTSGLDETNFSCVTPNCLNYVAPVGTRWAYHNGPYNLLKDIIEDTSGQTLNTFSNTRIENPIGMSGYWISFLGTSFYISTARDMARFGLLVANKGTWDTTSILTDTNYWHQMVNTSQSLNPSYGYLWWLNGKSSYIPPDDASQNFASSIAPNAPSDLYAAAGSQGQYISISPSLGFVMIRQGSTPTSNYTEFSLHDQIWEKILNLECTTTSVGNTQKSFGFTIQNGKVKVNNDQISKLAIYDLTGRELLSAYNNEIDVSTVTPAIYVLWMVSNEGKFYSEKIFLH